MAHPAVADIHAGEGELPIAAVDTASAAAGQIAIAASAAVDSDDGDLTACGTYAKRTVSIGAGHADSSERGSPTESAIAAGMGLQRVPKAAG